MTARTYGLDPNAAKEAGGGSKRVDQSGLYPGTILFAWGSINDKGTEAVNLIIDCDNGQKLEQSLYTYNGKGEQLPSYKMVSAIMTCCSVRTLTPQRGDVTRYDYEAKADMIYKEDVYPELIGKRFISAVQIEEYVNGQGQTKNRPIIVGAYNAESRRNAAEILAKPPGEPRAIEAQTRWLEQNPVKASRQRQVAVAGPPYSGSATATQNAGFDDGVPF